MARETNRPLCALVLLGAAAAMPAAQGAHYFESSSNTEIEGGAPIAAQVRGWIDGERARIEFVSGQAMPFAGSGGYMLTNDGGQTLYLVNPAERTYSEFDIEQMLGMAGTMMQAMGGMVRMEFSDVVNEKLGEEPGGTILGRSTTHYRYRTGYTMSMAILGMKRGSRVDTEQEFWCTSALDDAAFKVWLSPDRLRTGNEELDKIIRLQYQDLDCLPLRSRTTSVTKGDNQPEARTVATTEVTALREESAPAGTFDLPSGFTAKELMPQMPDMSQMPGMPGAGSSPDSGGGDSAPQEGRRPRLRDFLPGR
jgi:hypothetical protein